MFSGDLGDALVNVSINVCFFSYMEVCVFIPQKFAFHISKGRHSTDFRDLHLGVISVEYTFVGEIVGSRHSYLTCHPS